MNEKLDYLKENFNPPLKERISLTWEEFCTFKMCPFSEVATGQRFRHANITWIKIDPTDIGSNALSHIMGMSRKTRIEPHKKVYVWRSDED